LLAVGLFRVGEDRLRLVVGRDVGLLLGVGVEGVRALVEPVGGHRGLVEVEVGVWLRA